MRTWRRARVQLASAAIVIAGAGAWPALAVAMEDQIAIHIAQFDGPPAIGLGVANVIKLKLQAKSRSADRARQGSGTPPFGGGYYSLSALPVRPPRHDTAEHRARVDQAQMALWGTVTPLASEVLIKASLSIPRRYIDFRQTANEDWQVSLGGQSLAVSLPRRRVDFALQRLPRELVEYYAKDLRKTPICKTKALRSCPDTVGDGVRFLKQDGDRIRVRYPTNKYGWISFPTVLQTAHSIVVDFTSGCIALFRSDWEQASTAFRRVAANDQTSARTRSDAHLLRAMSLARSGKDGTAAAQAAVDINRFNPTAVRYLVMAHLSNAARAADNARRGSIDKARALLESKRTLLADRPDWLTTAVTMVQSN